MVPIFISHAHRTLIGACYVRWHARFASLGHCADPCGPDEGRRVHETAARACASSRCRRAVLSLAGPSYLPRACPPTSLCIPRRLGVPPPKRSKTDLLNFPPFCARIFRPPWPGRRPQPCRPRRRNRAVLGVLGGAVLGPQARMRAAAARVWRRPEQGDSRRQHRSATSTSFFSFCIWAT